MHQNLTQLPTNQIAFYINKRLWDKRKKAKSESPRVSKIQSSVYENRSIKDMSFRMCGLWSAALTFTCTNGLCRTIDRDYVNMAPGLGAVTGIQEPMESLKGKKTQVPLWQEVTDEWYSYIHRESLPPCCAHSLWMYSFHWETENWLQKKWSLESVSIQKENLMFLIL